MVTVTVTATNNRATGTKIIAPHMSRYQRRSEMIRARQRESKDDRFIEEITPQEHYNSWPHVTNTRHRCITYDRKLNFLLVRSTP
jgi:hypothetical protein